MPTKTNVRYLIFDVESVADGRLVSDLRYPKEKLSPEDAIRRYRDELMAKYESDFIPYTFQLPVSVAIAKTAADYSLIDIVTLDEPEFRPHVITQHFWQGWKAYNRPTFVTFNGRGFDLPLLELSAFRYGITMPDWMADGARSYEQPRNRYNTSAHIDLADLLTNFGATRFTGGLNLAANLLGKPGKMDVQGDMVQDMYDQGRHTEINDYCRCDVLDTYFVFLRGMLMQGHIDLQREQTLIAEAKAYLEERAESMPAYQAYLERWGDWENPWEKPVVEEKEIPAEGGIDLEG